MASNVVNLACYCYLIVLAVCVEQGDGRWRRRGRARLEHDIVIFRKIADDIEQEIEDFYDEYPDKEVLYDEIDEFYRQHPGVDGEETESAKSNELEQNSSFIPLNETSDSAKKLKGSALNRVIKNDTFELLPLVKHESENNDREAGDIKYNWPKFDDILLSIGKQYDWKTDRWIKVKKKFKASDNVLNVKESRDSFLAKHRFIYRMIKMNRSKSKRNIVVAVKAVR